MYSCQEHGPICSRHHRSAAIHSAGRQSPSHNLTMTTRGGTDDMFPTKILLATDGSAEAARAAQMATAISKRLDSEVHVAYVARMPDPYTWPEATVFDP